MRRLQYLHCHNRPKIKLGTLLRLVFLSFFVNSPLLVADTLDVHSQPGQSHEDSPLPLVGEGSGERGADVPHFVAKIPLSPTPLPHFREGEGLHAIALHRQPASKIAHPSRAVLLTTARAGSRLLVAGERGIVLWSDDHGLSWQQADVPVSVTLTKLYFANATEGWAAGHSGVILHTTDGGKKWRTQRNNRSEADPDDGDSPLFDIRFFDTQRGIAVGAYGMFLATQNGGKTWRTRNSDVDNPDGLHLYAIGGTAPVLYIVGEQGLLYRSTDSGSSFTPLGRPYDGSYFGTLQKTPHVFVFGLRGKLYRSDDQGDTWHPLQTGVSSTLTAAYIKSDDSMIILTQGGDVLRSTDSGNTFLHVDNVPPLPYTDVVQADDGSLILTSPHGVIRLP